MFLCCPLKSSNLFLLVQHALACDERMLNRSLRFVDSVVFDDRIDKQ